MDYLSLCNKFRSKAGISGTGLQSVAGNVGEYDRIVDWIQEAWTKIQLLPYDWKWQWRQYSLETILNTPDYVLTGVDSIHKSTFTSYDKAIGVKNRKKMTYKDWDSFQSKYATTSSDPKRPVTITRKPNGDVCVNPDPDGVYVIQFEYQKTPQVLAANTDIPELPEEFHMMIMFRALMDHGGFEESQDVFQYAQGEYDRLLRSLISNQKMVRPDQWVVRPQ